MIPASPADLDALMAEAERQNAEVRSLVEAMTREASGWRPAPERWSAVGHVAHLCRVNGPYLAAMEACMERARADGLLGNGPYRHPWLGSWFTRSMEPPPKRRVRTFRWMVPDPAPEATDIEAQPGHGVRSCAGPQPSPRLVDPRADRNGGVSRVAIRQLSV